MNKRELHAQEHMDELRRMAGDRHFKKDPLLVESYHDGKSCPPSMKVIEGEHLTLTVIQQKSFWERVLEWIRNVFDRRTS